MSRHDPVAGVDSGPCDNVAPDSAHPDPAERDVCTTCFHRRVDHKADVAGARRLVIVNVSPDDDTTAPDIEEVIAGQTELVDFTGIDQDGNEVTVRFQLAELTFDDLAEKQGWTEQSQLGILRSFIAERGLDTELAQHAFTEVAQVENRP